MTTNEVTAMAFDAILSTPGMNDLVKIDLKMTRRDVLLLKHVLQRGINPEEGELSPVFLASIGKEALDVLETIGVECLEKAGLVDTDMKVLKMIKGK